MNKIFVFNNLTKRKELLEPLNPPQLKIYTCGPTVYDHSHIGHARSAICWDFIVRFLKFVGFQVIWVRNITDIDDKIINKAKEVNLHPDKIARIFTYSFHEDMLSLGVDWPDFEPKATQYLTQMHEFIKGLLKSRAAYQIENDIYFSISSYKNYGQLKGQTLAELEKGYSRIEPNPKKRHSLDFALWKGVKDSKEYGFDSPWGKGRPGWHLECSCMNFCLFGETVDIHSGGDDLIFPHHENEIAESESLTGKPFSKYWLHNGMIMVESKKMAKSEGNFITIKDALKTTTGNALRLFVLNSHYRMPLNYTQEAIMSAQNGVYRINEALEDSSTNSKNLSAYDLNNEFVKEFVTAMSDDFNSPQALAVLFKLTDKINTEKNKETKSSYQQTLHNLSQTLGFNLTSNNIDKHIQDKLFSQIVDKLIRWRIECRSNKDYTSSDKIRGILNDCSIEVKDLSENQYKWQIKI